MSIIIILIVLLIVVFLLSNDSKFHNIINKRAVPLIGVLVVFYFLFNKMDIKLLLLAIVITALLSSDIINKRYLILDNFRKTVD